MSEENINLARIVNVEIRNDGEEVKIGFSDKDDKLVTVTLHVAQVDSLLMSLMKISSAVHLRLNVPMRIFEKPTEFSQPPQIHHVAEVEGVSYPEQSTVDFLFRTMKGESHQMCLPPELAQEVFRVLLEA
ncbi:MAG TPA: hypothetical protein VGP08_09670 [Pyrinomonadaceae bacterium]|jgi:hypothetical protein|nr:hypothetical protein [Pyrinomonadaceae bacterium]